jgi:hypothetical protein
VELASEAAAAAGGSSMSKPGRFGNYKPKNLGPEPAAPSAPEQTETEGAAPSAPATTDTTADAMNAELAALRSVKVPFSSRITVAADQQLKAMARQGHSQTALLSEALNLLFKKHGLTQVA